MADTPEKPRIRVPARRTADSFQNLEARLGIGSDGLSSQAAYGFNPITRNRQQLEWMYRGSWVVGKVVDAPAEDMVRAGIDLASVLPPGDGEAVLVGLQDRGVWKALEDGLKWSRLYGGAVAVMLIDGQDLSSPLRPEAISQGQFKGMLALDRWMVQPSLKDPVTELGPDLGKPKFYDVLNNAPALHGERIHYSRVVRFDGVELPYWQAQAENGWGMSVVERLFDRLVAFDSTTQGAAQLVFRAHLRTLYVKDYRTLVAAGGRAFDGFLRQMESIRRLQSSEGLTVLDAEDKFETHQYAFSGLDAVLMQFGQQLSGAADIPLVRMFGQSPAGLNSTGESDLRMYYDGINAQQESRLRRPLAPVIDVQVRSVTGRPPPKGFGFTFEPLWQLSDKEKAEIAKTITETVLGAKEIGIVSDQTALKELRQSSDVTGVWSNITDKDIEAAEDTIPEPSDIPPPDAAEPVDVPALPAAA